jgi:hypothetical protein
MKEGEPFSTIIWFEKSGAMDNIENITQKHIYNLGPLHSINILDKDKDDDDDDQSCPCA